MYIDQHWVLIIAEDSARLAALSRGVIKRVQHALEDSDFWINNLPNFERKNICEVQAKIKLLRNSLVRRTLIE